jgi:hypothetical protein
MIESYDFGAMVVDGQKFTADLIILPSRVNPAWWRKEGHRLALEDLPDIHSEAIEALVIGTGFFGLMKVPEDVQQQLKDRGLELHIEKTGNAVKLFNTISRQKRTAGAFHLTC